MGALSVGLLAVVTAHVILGQQAFTHADLQGRVQQKRLTVEELQLDNARLRAPGRVARRAAELGMVPATDPTILVAGGSGSGGPTPEGEGR